MSSIVLELQAEILSGDCDIVNILRKAHVVASKLKLDEFDTWIQYELNGYTHCSNDIIPEYRRVFGTLKAFNPYRGWIPAVLPSNELEKIVCERKMTNSISELIQLYANSETGYCSLQFNTEQMQSFAQLFKFDFQYALFISIHFLNSIVERVKNTLLEWTIKLEADGILGEDMNFTKEEKESAKNIPQSISKYYGPTNILNGTVYQSQLVAGDTNNISFNYNKVKELIHEVKDSAYKENLKVEDKAILEELVEEIIKKITQKKSPSIIKSAFIGLKDFLLNVGAGATVALIQSKMQGLW